MFHKYVKNPNLLGNLTFIDIFFKSKQFSVKSLEDGEFGNIDDLQMHIKRDLKETKSIDPIDDQNRIYHAMSHPSVIEAFLKVYKGV